MLVFDNEGHLVDDTGYSGSDKQAWLDGLAAIKAGPAWQAKPLSTHVVLVAEPLN
jgi:hypothetical protein